MQNRRDGEKIFSKDVNKSGAKIFMAKTLDDMWTEMQTGTRNYCEVIEDKPCHLYFDLDDGDVKKEVVKLKKMLNRIFRELKIKIRYVVLDASKGTKQSMHVIVKGEKYILQSPGQGLAFVQRMKALTQDMPLIDEKVYTRHRCFRMLANSKYGQKRDLSGLAWTRENWISSLVQPVEMEAYELGLHRFESVATRADRFPPCFEAVFDWVGANKTYINKCTPVGFEYIGHLNKGVCLFAGREHRSNNRWFKFDGTMTIGCFACRKPNGACRTYAMKVPHALMKDVRTFLNQKI